MAEWTTKDDLRKDRRELSGGAHGRWRVAKVKGSPVIQRRDLKSARRLLGAVLVGVCLGGFVGEMRGVEMVGVGDVRVMRGFLVRTGVVMFRGFLVMACRVFVMLRRFPMMLGCFLGH